MTLDGLWLEGIPSTVLFWASAAIVLLVIEIATVGFFCLFFTIGAIFAAITAFFVSDVFIQMAVFVVTSLLALAFARPLLKKMLNIQEQPQQQSNTQALINQKVLILTPITRYDGKVKVVHTGEIWTAYLDTNFEDADLQPNQEALIMAIDGAKLVVKPLS